MPAAAVAAPADEGIEQHGDELAHRLERGLLRSGRGFARDLRQPRRRQRDIADGNAAVAVEEAGQRVADVLLVAVEIAERIVVQRQIEEDVVGVVAQTWR